MNINVKEYLSKFSTRRIIVSLRDHFKKIPKIIFDTINEFLDDKALKMGASLSYYTLISLAPIIIILIAVIGFIYGDEAAKGEIVKQISDIVGQYAAETVQSLILSAATPGTGFIATIIGVSVLIFTSVAVFVELKESLNMIWGVEPIPGQGLKNLIYYRVRSFIVVAVIGLFLFLSIILSTVTILIRNFTDTHFPDFVQYLTYINAFTSIVMITTLFAMIFKYLPDVKIKWKYVWFGAVITSGLFYIGKYLISMYLQHATLSSTYGAAGSLVVFLVWINYSSLIMFFGAELTQVTKRTYSSSPLEPKPGFLIIRKTSALVAARFRELAILNKKEDDKDKSD